MPRSRVVVATKVDGYIFDAYIKTEHSRTVKLTENPVQGGAAVVDHSYNEPNKLTMQIAMTDSAVAVGGRFSGGEGRSVNAYKTLVRIMTAREPITVTTRLGSYKNMIIIQMTASETRETMHALDCTITLQEIITASVSIVKVSASPQVTGSTNRGTPQVEEPNQSALSLLNNLIFGGD